MKFLPLLVFVQLFFSTVRDGEWAAEPSPPGSAPVWVTLQGQPERVRYFLDSRCETKSFEIMRWIRLLGSDSFEVRVDAEARLVRQGPGIIPILERSLSDCGPEAFLRTQRIIKRLWLRSF